MGRIIVFGDVHGCRAELEALLDAVAIGSGDALVSVGDLVAKGPDSKGVVALCRRLGVRAVRGNHDEHCLRWHRAVAEEQPPPRLGRRHREVCEALDDEDWGYLAATPLTLHLPAALHDRDVLIVHAGVDPRSPLDRQQPDLLMNIRSVRPDGEPSRRIEGEPWARLWPGPEFVIFGHDAVRGLQRYPHALGLDTGCVYGGRLSAAILDGDIRLASVPAKRVWSPPTEAP